MILWVEHDLSRSEAAAINLVVGHIFQGNKFFAVGVSMLKVPSKNAHVDKSGKRQKVFSVFVSRQCTEGVCDCSHKELGMTPTKFIISNEQNIVFLG